MGTGRKQMRPVPNSVVAFTAMSGEVATHGGDYIRSIRLRRTNSNAC
jgi:hypothetical protein